MQLFVFKVMLREQLRSLVAGLCNKEPQTQSTRTCCRHVQTLQLSA